VVTRTLLNVTCIRTLRVFSNVGVRRTISQLRWFGASLGSRLLRNADIYQLHGVISGDRYFNHVQKLPLHCAVHGLDFRFFPHNFTKADLQHGALL